MGNNSASGNGGHLKSTENDGDNDGHRRSRPLPPLPEAGWPLFVGKYDYDSRTEDDLGFKKGDLLYIINSNTADWWFAQQRVSGDKGFVPSNYVAEYKSLDAEDWFFGNITTRDAEKLLMQNSNQCGSFLVRNNEKVGQYSLAIRTVHGVSRYRVRRYDTGRLFITSRVTFETIQELVEYYKQRADGLCMNLKHACLPAEKPQTPGLSKAINENWEIDKQSLRLVRQLDAGEFGEVWEGQWNTKTAVAVKILQPGIIRMDKLLQESTIMIRLRHPKLVQLYAICTKEEPTYIVTELMTHGSLLDYLHDNGQKLDIEQLLDMSAQVAAGMAFLELQCYVHGDLAARNILVGDNMICKVADFGLARVISENYKDGTEPKLRIRWTAPEAVLYNRFTIKSDVWSFGILLYETVTHGQLPYPGMSNAQVLEAIQQDYRMLCPMECPSELYEVMWECWKEDPESRPMFETLQQRLKDFATK